MYNRSGLFNRVFAGREAWVSPEASVVGKDARPQPARPRASSDFQGFRSEIRAGLAGGPGFEPRLTESESAVLPLNYPPAAPTKGRVAGARRRHSRLARWVQAPSRLQVVKRQIACGGGLPLPHSGQLNRSTGLPSNALRVPAAGGKGCHDPRTAGRFAGSIGTAVRRTGRSGGWP